MKSIPTTYKNIQFRSRLEATWASFFDKLQWRWEYEPFDLDDWIPDFVLKGKGKQVLVEVKPIAEFDLDTAKKIQKAGKDYEILLLGHSLLDESSLVYDTDLALGWLLDNEVEWDKKSEWNLAEFTVWDKPTSSSQLRHRYKIGFADSICDFTCRITDQHDKGGHFLSFYKSEQHPDYEKVKELITKNWGASKNKTQWKKPK
jgi:hypothetical protein